jgi:hypothetical protein
MNPKGRVEADPSFNCVPGVKSAIFIAKFGKDSISRVVDHAKINILDLMDINLNPLRMPNAFAT